MAVQVNLVIVLLLVFSHNLFAAEEAHFCKSTGSSKTFSIIAIDMPLSLGSRFTIQKYSISTLYYTGSEKGFKEYMNLLIFLLDSIGKQRHFSGSKPRWTATLVSC